jgi:hypothetical protein
VWALATVFIAAALATEVFVTRKSFRIPPAGPARAQAGRSGAPAAAAGPAPSTAAIVPADPSGNESGSADVLPPAGSLAVLVMPWADIEWIENLDSGERVEDGRAAPARLALSPGRYRLRLVNPYAAGPLEVDAVVKPGELSTLRATLPGFDAAAIAREILAGETGREGA